MGGTFSYLFSSATRQHSSQTASQDVTDSEPHKKVKKVIRQKSSQFKLKTHLLLFKLRVQIHPTETAQFFNKLPQPNELKPETQDNGF